MPRIFGSASTGSGGTPGGSTTQVQYNNAGAFGGVTGATTNGTFLTLTTPVLGAATGTSLALGGATIGANALAVTGNANISGSLTLSNTLSMTDANITRVSGLYFGSAIDTILTRGGAAATLQHGAADAASPVAQTIKFQDVATGTSNTAGVNATIQAPAGTGTGAGGSLIFQVAPAGSTGTAKNAWATALTIDSTKLATFNGGVTASADIRLGNTGTLFWGTTGSQIYGGTNGNLQLTNQAGSDFGRLQFGGTTSSFPALKRSTTSLQAKLADDSAFAAIQGKLTTDTAYTAGDPTTTGYLLVYDSTGTAYRVPALLN